MNEQAATLNHARDTLIDLAIRFGPRLLTALLILALGVAASRWVSRALARALSRRELEPPIRLLLTRVTAARCMVLFVIMSLQNLGVELLPLIAGLGVVGAGLALATQGVLGNVMAGLSIIFTKPFRVGEYIAIAGVEGVVQGITLFSTTLVHVDHSHVVVPNRKIVGEILHNYGRIRQLDVSCRCRLRHRPATRPRPHRGGAAGQRARPHRARGGGPARPLGDSSVGIAVRPWVLVEDLTAAGGEVTAAVLAAFNARGVVIPVPQREVRLIGGANRPREGPPLTPVTRVPDAPRRAMTNTEVFLLAMGIIYTVPYLSLAAAAHRLLRATGGGADHRRHPARAGRARQDPARLLRIRVSSAGDRGAKRHRLVGGDGVRVPRRTRARSEDDLGAPPGVADHRNAGARRTVLLGAAAAAVLRRYPGWAGTLALGWQFVLGVGMACAVTALPVLILLMERLEILRQPIGQRMLRYASLDDVAIWAVLAVILMDWARIGRQTGFLLMFAAASWVFRRLMRALPPHDRWYVALIWLVLCAWGADWAGCISLWSVPVRSGHGCRVVRPARNRSLSPLPAARLHAGVLSLHRIAHRLNLGGGAVLLAAAGLLIAAVGGKLFGVQLAGRMLGWPRGEAAIIGWLLQTKGRMIVFANVLLDKHLITDDTFTALLLMALASTMLTVPVVAPGLARARGCRRIA